VSGPAAVALAALVRWTNLVALAGVVGGLVAELLLLPRDGNGLAAVQQRLRRLTFASLTLLVVASGADLIERARTMAEGGIGAAVAALALVLGRTHFGVMWRLRASTIAIVALLCWTRARSARLVALATMLAAVFTLAASGHAADWGDATATTIVDWVHASAAFAWGGGLGALWWCVFRAPPSLSSAALVTITRRFSRLALACAAAIVLSGSFNAYVEVAELPALWSSAYGRVLALKVVLVLGALALGAMNRYRLLPALSESAERVIAERPPDRASARLLMSRYVAGEVILVVVVFGCTALLGQLPPPRRGDAFHDASHTHVE